MPVTNSQQFIFYYQNKKHHGFTLVELLVVIAIIGILAAIALPQFNSYRKKSKASKLTDQARTCAMEQVAFCNGNINPAATTLQLLQTCTNLANNTMQLPSKELINNNNITDSCNTIIITAGATIETTSYTSTCRGAYDQNIICTLTP